MLRDWKQYGMEDIYLDKPNSIIYGRVGESNCTSNFLPLYSPSVIGANLLYSPGITPDQAHNLSN